MKNAYRASSNIRFASMIAISIGMGLLGTTASLAADKVGVSMPNVKGPWFTPVLYGISDEAKKLGYDVIIQDAGGYANVDKQVSQFQNLVVLFIASEADRVYASPRFFVCSLSAVNCDCMNSACIRSAS